jgi:hypothetical protein
VIHEHRHGAACGDGMAEAEDLDLHDARRGRGGSSIWVSLKNATTTA